MVYFTSWDAFAEAAEKLFLEKPDTTRYTFKYRHTKGYMVLKVTDDIVVYKYKTNQQQDLKRIEKMNNTFIRDMSSRKLETAAMEVEH